MNRTDVEAAIRKALAKLNRPAPEFTLPDTPYGDATPHVEGMGPQFDLVISERGQERERQTVDGDELIFYMMSGITCAMAQSEELRTRTTRKRPFGLKPRPLKDDDYSRGTWIEAHVRLMECLRPYWAARVRHEYEETLRRYPLTPEENANQRHLDLSAFGLED